jgi:hypothetical protein
MVNTHFLHSLVSMAHEKRCARAGDAATPARQAARAGVRCGSSAPAKRREVGAAAARVAAESV